MNEGMNEWMNEWMKEMIIMNEGMTEKNEWMGEMLFCSHQVIEILGHTFRNELHDVTIWQKWIFWHRITAKTK